MASVSSRDLQACGSSRNSSGSARLNSPPSFLRSTPAPCTPYYRHQQDIQPTLVPRHRHGRCCFRIRYGFAACLELQTISNIRLCKSSNTSLASYLLNTAPAFQSIQPWMHLYRTLPNHKSLHHDRLVLPIPHFSLFLLLIAAGRVGIAVLMRQAPRSHRGIAENDTL
jgi:hypothetical protein